VRKIANYVQTVSVRLYPAAFGPADGLRCCGRFPTLFSDRAGLGSEIAQLGIENTKGSEGFDILLRCVRVGPLLALCRENVFLE
jgi:hypothetical protein